MRALENLTLRQAELKSQIHFIENYNPENIDPEIEITELEIKIEELEKLKSNLIKQLKLSTNIDT
jgi:hypothetical protein